MRSPISREHEHAEWPGEELARSTDDVIHRKKSLAFASSHETSNRWKLLADLGYTAILSSWSELGRRKWMNKICVLEKKEICVTSSLAF